MQRRLTMLSLFAAGVLGMVGSSWLPPVVAPLVDADQDGWFDEPTNVAMVASLSTATFPVFGQSEVLVDEIKFPLSPSLDGAIDVPIGSIGTPVAIGIPVATRVRGVQGFGAAGTPFGANVRVLYRPLPLGPWVVVGDARVMFGETAGALPPTSVGSVSLVFSVATTTFADPTPNDANGDADSDGVPEIHEARMSAAFGGLFDPRPGSARDVDLIIGHTDPAYALSQWSREDLRTRFIQNGINLHLDEGMLNNAPGQGGQMNLSGTGATAHGVVDEVQTLAVRDLNVGPTRSAGAYFLLMANRAALSRTGQSVFGLSSNRTIVMQTGFIGINDIAWYQSGVLMHELGHHFGLCHPISQDGATASMCGTCAAIPLPQRDGGLSVMGAPSDDPNLFDRGYNILRRPLDFAPAQWPLVSPACGFPP